MLLSSPDVTEDDVTLVTEVLRSGYLASGPFAERFENEFAARFGARFGVATSSGTAALHMAVIAAGVGEGDLVLTTPYSFVASANAILYERGIPVFVDVDPTTHNLDAEKAAETIDTLVHRKRGWRALLPRSFGGNIGALRAVMPVHLFGCPAEMGPLVTACRHAGIPLLEDACESLGARADGEYAGRWGKAGAFGFYPNKQITTGEGGMLLTDDPEWATLFRSLRNQGRSADTDWLRYERLGFNYRMDEMSAALGLSQFRRLDTLLEKRAEVARRYSAFFESVEGVEPLPVAREGMTRTWFLYVLRVAEHVDRDALMRRLAARGVPTRPYFWPIHLQPFYVERFAYQSGDFPNAERAGTRMLSLPMGPDMPDADIDYVCEAVRAELAA